MPLSFSSFLKKNLLFLFISFCALPLFSQSIRLGLDQVFNLPYVEDLKGKKIGLVTNQASCNSLGSPALSVFLEHQKKVGYEMKAFFAPEHGLKADLEAFAFVHDETLAHLPVYSLHGSTKRPSQEMLRDLDLLIFDLQTVGTRCYTYETTLFYVIEEAVKAGLEVWVLDRPNPLGGERVMGPLLQERYKCFFGYLEIPFIHGMTIGELALYFKTKKKLDLELKVIPMRGWNRGMHFEDTGLKWKATSPNIPDSETTLVYPATIALGESLEIVNVDKGGEHPFKRVGAPWVKAQDFADLLNAKNCEGVYFEPHTFVPRQGNYKNEACQGVFVQIKEKRRVNPIEIQKALVLCLHELYPDALALALEKAEKKGRLKTCDYLTGNTALTSALKEPLFFDEMTEKKEAGAWKSFMELREKCLLY